MRRLFVLLLAACVLVTGCGSSKPVPQPQPLRPVAELIDQLAEDYELTMPVSLDEKLVTELLDIPKEQFKSFCGYLSMDGEQPDCLVAVEAAPGCAEEVAKTLDARRSFMLDAYREQPEAYSRVQAGSVVFVGDYAFLIVAGRPSKDPVEEIASIITAIEDNFKK